MLGARGGFMGQVPAGLGAGVVGMGGEALVMMQRVDGVLRGVPHSPGCS